jgi:hypothetical protein
MRFLSPEKAARGAVAWWGAWPATGGGGFVPGSGVGDRVECEKWAETCCWASKA